jgi:hypothetical protein
MFDNALYLYCFEFDNGFIHTVFEFDNALYSYCFEFDNGFIMNKAIVKLKTV